MTQQRNMLQVSIEKAALVILLAWPAMANAEELEGLVRVAGSAMNSEVLLMQEGSQTGPAVCYDEIGKKIGRFAGMTVKVQGDEWRTRKSGEKICLIGKNFTITKAPSGRPPIIGKLSESSGTFVVTADDGKQHKLNDVPTGMKKLSGQKVILDAKPMEAPGGKEPIYKVVSYGVYPQ